MTTRKKLCAIKGISEAKVDKIKEVVVKLGGVCLTKKIIILRYLVQIEVREGA